MLSSNLPCRDQHRPEPDRLMVAATGLQLPNPSHNCGEVGGHSWLGPAKPDLGSPDPNPPGVPANHIPRVIYGAWRPSEDHHIYSSKQYNINHFRWGTIFHFVVKSRVLSGKTHFKMPHWLTCNKWLFWARRNSNDDYGCIECVFVYIFCQVSMCDCV